MFLNKFKLYTIMKSLQKPFAFIVLLAFLTPVLIAQISHVDPPFWWTGLKNHNLQIMVYAKDISNATVEIDYKGIEILAAHKAESPNYLFIDLLLSEDIKPGKFDIRFLMAKKEAENYSYELKEREKASADREGFNSSDVMYLIMPDRFVNGDPSNDVISSMKENKIDRKNPYGRHGGDIKGIIDHLDYFDEIGFTALWLNPLLENDQPDGSYHGYATTDFYKVDSRYGSNEDYKSLCRKAKEKDIKMVMDMIFNHCGSEHWWMEDLPFADWINLYPNYKITNHRHSVIQDPHASRYEKKIMNDGWFVKTMPDLNQRNSFLAEYLIQNSIWWIEYLGLSGIRMDTYPYADKYMMAEWNKRVLEEYPNFNIVGEEWTSNPAAVSYWQKGKVNSDGYNPGLPSLMDFPLQNALTQSLITVDKPYQEGLNQLYEALANDFLYPNPENLVVFMDNHDMPRFYMQMGMDIDLLKLGITYILTTRGIPQIFYGTEILMTHIEDNDHGNIRKECLQ